MRKLAPVTFAIDRPATEANNAHHEVAPRVAPGVSAEQAFPDSHSLRSEVRAGAGRLAGRKRPAAPAQLREGRGMTARY